MALFKMKDNTGRNKNLDFDDNISAFYEGLTEEQKKAQIPRYVHDIDMARMSNINKRTNRYWFIAFMVVFLAFVGTNAYWINRENQYEDIYIEQQGETDGGGSNYFNGTGELSFYGESATGYTDSQIEDGR